ncbi:MAG TPA: HD domain-containing phosphohydrolase [Desulfatiglandales bacterium]|nr:HD domain-containing phosphohydrolase [Desulfatiglandales bacterium]
MALLYDIGLYDIPQDIIYKNEKVSQKEYDLLKIHPTISHEKLATTQFDKIIPNIALEHHERVNGEGYPRGIINLSEITELFGMVDFFEAVTHQRPQRGPVTPHEGIQMLMGMKHKMFTRKMLTDFINVFSIFPVYSVVRLNSGEIGQVIKANVNWILRPLVSILFKSDGQPVSGRKEIDLSKDKILFITKDISDRVFIDRHFKL